jgi:hypothetical protein|tara:strand:+ start:4895 stop:5083 length:189 start_codon:yes stop_codon:yes gene_type:complete
MKRLMTRFFTNKVVVITGLLMLGFFETFITLVAWCPIMLIVISMAIKDEVIDSINKFKNKKQ